MNTEYLLAGFGGQGILFAGKLLAYIGLTAGKEVSWLPSYGPAMRGGTCNCSVVIGESQIGSPLVLEPDALIVMNKPSFDKFAPCVRPGGIIFADGSLISDAKDIPGVKLIKVPATQLARENNLKGMANIILLGKALDMLKIADEEAVRLALTKNVGAKKPELLEANLRAMELGKSA